MYYYLNMYVLPCTSRAINCFFLKKHSTVNGNVQLCLLYKPEKWVILKPQINKRELVNSALFNSFVIHAELKLSS